MKGLLEEFKRSLLQRTLDLSIVWSLWRSSQSPFVSSFLLPLNLRLSRTFPWKEKGWFGNRQDFVLEQVEEGTEEAEESFSSSAEGTTRSPSQVKRSGRVRTSSLVSSREFLLGEEEEWGVGGNETRWDWFFLLRLKEELLSTHNGTSGKGKLFSSWQ